MCLSLLSTTVENGFSTIWSESGFCKEANKCRNLHHLETHQKKVQQTGPQNLHHKTSKRQQHTPTHSKSTISIIPISQISVQFRLISTSPLLYHLHLPTHFLSSHHLHLSTKNGSQKWTSANHWVFIRLLFFSTFLSWMMRGRMHVNLTVIFT